MAVLPRARTSDKVFAPGYGEFDTSSDGEVEALALAVPEDAVAGPVPVPLRFMSTSAWGILENVRLGDWEAAGPTLSTSTASTCTRNSSGCTPPRETRLQ